MTKPSRTLVALAFSISAPTVAFAESKLSDKDMYEALAVRSRVEMAIGFKAWCISEVPSTKNDVEAATSAWLSRNQSQIEKSNSRIKLITDPDTIAALSEENSFTKSIFEELSKRPEAKKNSICQNLPTKLLAPEMDTNNAPQLAEEMLAKYKGKH